jgi:hypothetical protein
MANLGLQVFRQESKVPAAEMHIKEGKMPGQKLTRRILSASNKAARQKFVRTDIEEDNGGLAP